MALVDGAAYERVCAERVAAVAMANKYKALADDLADEVRMLRATLIRMAKAAGPAWTPRWGDAGAPTDDVLARYQEVRQQ